MEQNKENEGEVKIVGDASAKAIGPRDPLQSSAEDAGRISAHVPIAERIHPNRVRVRRRNFQRWINERRARVTRLLLAQCNGKCGWCGGRLRTESTGPLAITFDHIIPICYGGRPSHKSNPRLVHSACNTERGDSLFLTVYQLRSAQPIAAASPTEVRDTAESGTVVPTTDAPQ